MPLPPGAHKTAPIGPASNANLFAGSPGCELLGFINQSQNNQASAISVYDGPSVSAVQQAVAANSSQTQYPLIVQPFLVGGQVLDLTLKGRGILMNYGIVIISQGTSNTDGGVTTVFD